MPLAGRIRSMPWHYTVTPAQARATGQAFDITQARPRQTCCRASPEAGSLASLVLPSRLSRPSIMVPPDQFLTDRSGEFPMANVDDCAGFLGQLADVAIRVRAKRDPQ